VTAVVFVPVRVPYFFQPDGVSDGGTMQIPVEVNLATAAILCIVS
jgi:hypothetical protein